MDWKRGLGLALCAVALALVVWGLFFAKLDRMVSIKIDLPPAEIPQSRRVEVFVGADNSIRVGDKPSSVDAVVRDVAAQAPTPDRGSQLVRVHTPSAAPEETIIAVLKRLQEGGWTKVGLVQEP